MVLDLVEFDPLVPHATAYSSERAVNLCIDDGVTYETRILGRTIHPKNCFRRFKLLEQQSNIVIERWLLVVYEDECTDTAEFFPIAIKPISHSEYHPMLALCHSINSFLSLYDLRQTKVATLADCWHRCEEFISMRYGAPCSEDIMTLLLMMYRYGITPVTLDMIPTAEYLMREVHDPYSVVQGFEEALGNYGVVDFMKEFGSIDKQDFFTHIALLRPYRLQDFVIFGAPTFGMYRHALNLPTVLKQEHRRLGLPDANGQLSSTGLYQKLPHFRDMLDYALCCLYPAFTVSIQPNGLIFPGMSASSPLIQASLTAPAIYQPGLIQTADQCKMARCYESSESMLRQLCLKCYQELVEHMQVDYSKIEFERTFDEFLYIKLYPFNGPPQLWCFDLFLHLLLSDALLTPQPWFMNLGVTIT